VRSRIVRGRALCSKKKKDVGVLEERVGEGLGSVRTQAAYTFRRVKKDGFSKHIRKTWGGSQLEKEGPSWQTKK